MYMCDSLATDSTLKLVKAYIKRAIVEKMAQVK